MPQQYDLGHDNVNESSFEEQQQYYKNKSNNNNNGNDSDTQITTSGFSCNQESPYHQQ